MYGPYQSGTARPYKMGGRLDRLSLVRAVPNLVRAVPSLVRAVPSLVRVVPGSPKMPFLRVFCSNPAENKQTLSSTKF